MDTEERLAALALAVQQLNSAESHVTEAVIRARMGGASWAEIGRLVGLTKQGAHKRYADSLVYDFPLAD